MHPCIKLLEQALSIGEQELQYLAAGQFDEIDTKRCQHGDHGLRVLGRETAALEIGRVELDRHRKAGCDGNADGAHDIEQQAGAVL